MNMKKIAATLGIILAALLVFAGCSKGSSSNTSDTTSTTVTANSDSKPTKHNELSFKDEDLILAYCNGTWDGRFISNTEHCASIEDGILWIDCFESEKIPDMGPLDPVLSFNEVIETSAEGTWIYNTECQIVELWVKGFRKELFPISTENAYSTSIYKVEGGFAVHCGSSLILVNEFGYSKNSFRNVIDVYKTDDGVWFSTFEHENYLITSVNGDPNKLSTTLVRYPGEQGVLTHSDDIRLTQAFNLFYGEGWDGKCRRLDSGEFMAIDYYGNIVVNNTIIGNVCLGDSVVNEYGPNIYLNEDHSYYLDGEQLIYFEHGPTEKKVDVPNGNAKFLSIEESYDEDRKDLLSVTIAAQSGDTLYLIENNSVKVIANGVVDARVAYDMLYYMVGNVVYSLDWLNPEAKPVVFFDDGAYAVSNHSDEAEGAIVPQEYANYEDYGYSNIYSPYGEGF